MGPACQRVLRLHCRPEVQHWRPGLPTVHVRPLAGSSWMPSYRRHQAQPDCGGVQEEEGAETWTPHLWTITWTKCNLLPLKRFCIARILNWGGYFLNAASMLNTTFIYLNL